MFQKKDKLGNTENEVAESDNIQEETIISNDLSEEKNTSEKLQDLENIVTYLVGEDKIFAQKIEEIISASNQFTLQLSDAEGKTEKLLQENSELKEMISKLENNMVNKNVFYIVAGVSLLAIVLSIIAMVL